MEFTGERFIPTLSGDIRLEHLHRYEWCTAYTQGKRVLDIASGEGYGSYALARNAASVIGVDISTEAVSHARLKYSDNPNLKFLEGSAASIPLPENSVDVVVSFETIEHHDKHEEMMSEIRRVLTADGLFILSSPNKKIYSDLAGGDHNHFHVKELYFSELSELLGRHFKSVRYYGQRVTATSLLLPMETTELASDLQVYSETEGGTQKSVPSHIEAMYYLALATNDELPPPVGGTAFFSELDNAFYEKQREVLALSAEIRRMSDYIAEVSGVLKVRDSELATTRHALANCERKRITVTGLTISAYRKVMHKMRSLFGKK